MKEKELESLYNTIVSLNNEKGIIELNNIANKKVLKLEEEIKEFIDIKNEEIEAVKNTEEYKNFEKQIEDQQENINRVQNELADRLEARNKKSMLNIKITYSEKFNKDKFIEENPGHPAIVYKASVDRKLLKGEFSEDEKKYIASERKIKYQEK